MALRAASALPNLNFRLRAGNLNDCVSNFIRGDTAMLLCYEADTTRPLDFGPGVARGDWGSDYLVPVVGGALRYAVTADGRIPATTPAVAYPEDSYFGEALTRADRAFGTPSRSAQSSCVTAFSSGTKELVLGGIGVGWLPFSMVHREITSGDLISLANHLGQVELKVALFADSKVTPAMDLLTLWSK